MNTAQIYIFDLDGTLCDIRHRLPLIQGPKKDYDKFHLSCIKDMPIKPVMYLMEDLAKTNSDVEIHFLTGRSEIARYETIKWFKQFINMSLLDDCFKVIYDGPFYPSVLEKYQWSKSYPYAVSHDQQNVIIYDGSRFDLSLKMRPQKDHRPGAVYKKEVYERHYKYGVHVLGVFEDDKKVVDMWRSIGVQCYQVAEWE